MTPRLRSTTSSAFATALVLFVIASVMGPLAVIGFAQDSGAPHVLPGQIEAEDFDTGGAEVAYHDNSRGNSGGAYRATDVDIEGSRDAGVGYNVGWVSAGEWLNYTVSVATAGRYTIEVRVASPGAGGVFHIEADGIDKTGPLAVPNTGGWQTWTTVTRADVTLEAGTHSVRVVMDRVGSSGAVGNFNWIRVTRSASEGSTPYGGTPVALPGTIEAENFDDGGQKVAYHDSSISNSGGAYRKTDVDLQASRDVAGGYNVGWVSGGEWLNYTVNVAKAGTYTVEFRVASTGPGGTFHLEGDGVDKTGPLAVPDTGGWQTWTTVQHPAVTLAGGRQVLRLVMDASGTTGSVGNFNWIRATSVPSGGGSTPYGGTPVALPGTIEAENFDNGGAQIAYRDSSVGNSGGAYRKTDVDLQASRDAGGGFNVGWVTAGEWLNYTVNVAIAGVYTIEVRVASPEAGGELHVETNGVAASGRIAVPNTGSWQAWSTVIVPGVSLDAGTQVLRLVADTSGPGGACANVNWIRVAPQQTIPFAISAPSQGTPLRTRDVTFSWIGAGDEFWLNIGSGLGASDVYASGSLGTATEHTVQNLPLSGRTLYVEVRRRTGAVIDRVQAQYTAPVRKGLAVITDFADRTLETWTGAGIKTVADLSTQLRQMEDHWEWLSRGRETMQWDIVRIQLAQPAVPGAFASWVQFRETVGALARQQVDINEYDVNSDGVLDVSWFILSNGDVKIEDYAIGGASMNAGVNQFADGQASDSVRQGLTGNFNHEVGHLLGIVDMYGTHGTMGSLTLMAGSRDLPPNDFAPYERILLGWLAPRVVTKTTQGIWLPPPANQMAAVKVPTSQASEYFLIEYRKRPAFGFGSANLDHDGLVVYHVFEGSSMAQDPPVVKVEPADGRITPGVPTDPYDMVYPGNPYWTPPMVLRSYYGDGREVFRLDNVTWVNGGMSFDITMAPAQPTPSNLLTNGSFEIGQGGAPDGWISYAYRSGLSDFVWPSAVARSGASSAHVASSFDNDVSWSQAATTVVGQPYRMCGWLKGESIGGAGDTGGNISLLGTWVGAGHLLGTFDWTQKCVLFTSVTPRVEVACRLGFWSNLASGRLWCDDMTLERLRSAFQ
jgi:M6 family metalloprotease-like protein